MENILDGKALAKRIYAALQLEISQLNEQGITPCLGTLRIGERADQIAYERSLIKALEPKGFLLKHVVIDEASSQSESEAALDGLAKDESVHGILLFAPLPKHLDLEKIAARMPAEKDVDALSPVTLGNFFRGERDAFAPCTAEGARRIAVDNGVCLEGKEVVVLGRSLVVGKPLALLALADNATVTLAHSKTKDLPSVTRRAEVLFVAVGRAKMVKADMVSDGAVVVDVGINVDEEGALVGDVDFGGVSSKASRISPVPGGVGSVTTSILAEHIVRAAKKQTELVRLDG